MDEVYTSTLNSMTGNIYLKDAIIHCDEPLMLYFDNHKDKAQNHIHATHCHYILENSECCIKFL